MVSSEPLLGENPKSTQRWFLGLLLAFLGVLVLARWFEVNGGAHHQNTGDIEAVQKMFALFVSGKFQGEHCLAAAESIALDDVVYDASSDSMPHVSGAKVYHGVQGVCEFVSFLSTFRQPDYHLTEILHSGTGTVIVKEVLTPSVIATNKTAPHALQNLVEYHVRHHRLASMKVFWGEPHLFDSLFVDSKEG